MYAQFQECILQVNILVTFIPLVSYILTLHKLKVKDHISVSISAVFLDCVTFVLNLMCQ